MNFQINCFLLLALLLLFLQKSKSSLLNFTLYKGNPQQIVMPSIYYEDQDPFAASLTTSTILESRIIPGINTTITIGSTMDSFCTFDPFKIWIYPMIEIPMNTSSDNFEFISVQNFIYYFDSSNNMSVFQINTSSDGSVYNSLVKVNQYNTYFTAGENSFLRFFSDNSSNLYLVIDSSVTVYSISDNMVYPVFIQTISVGLRNASRIQNADYYKGCFVFLTANLYVDMFCLTALGNSFTVTQGLGDKSGQELLKNQTIQFNGWNYTDLLIDENGVLLVSDYNYGILAIDISNPKQPQLIGIYALNGVTMMKKVLQSLMVIRQFWKSPFMENHFEEYYTEIDNARNLFFFSQNEGFLISHNQVLGLHAARDYVILLQTDAMYLYRHSISSLLKPNLTPLQGFLSNGLIGIHRMDQSDKNLFIAMYPNEIAVYNIDIQNITLECNPTLDMKIGNYFLNFTVWSTSCPEMNTSVINSTTFPSCLYSVPTFAAVYDSGATGSSGSDKSGLIAGLTIGLFFGLVIIIVCGCYLIKVQRKYQSLTEKRGSQNQNMNAGRAGIIGGYEDSEKQSNEPQHFAPVNAEVISNRLEIEANRT